MPKDCNNYVNPEDDSDGSDGCDGSRGTANDINDNNVIVATATRQLKISSNIIDKMQDTTSRTVTAVISGESGNNTTDTQVSIPTTSLQQTRSETKQNTGEIYMSGTNWYCRHCKISGEKFFMEVHICKGTYLCDPTTLTSVDDFFFS